MSVIVVFGAGGRAGRAVLNEALSRDHRVVAAVRDPAKYRDLETDRVSMIRADVTDAAAVAEAAHGTDAAVHAVSPFSGPEGLDALDPAFFVKASDALLTGLASAGVGRLLVVGLFANMPTRSGGLVMDDPALLPPQIRPFAQAHTDGLDHLSAADSPLDWLMLTPPAALSIDLPRTGSYRIGTQAYAEEGQLSYADLAVAIIDEIEHPTHHRTRVPVYSH
ncbi:NAD(P)-dependent oxidoreductase [Acrocarpospora macrocephala]|uniref:3-beta hydroxysteroid dehydrogenase n=1 Tax=Acrocarpospora macrocephala TaxID=150177 RepID=A0A5M3WEN6_9ACTN|nr:NAD(P)H-binding protein [Acrocarpospora macrocephala]GES06710.1 3-beta hydroxysteroid dehydrogenase [Acrocarpospora macrocephala]